MEDKVEDEVDKSKVSLSLNVSHGSPGLGVSASPRASPWPGCHSSELCNLPPAHRAVEFQALHITPNFSLFFSPCSVYFV